jgi:hypothetical protein
MVRMTTKRSNLWLIASVLLATAASCGAEPPRAVPTFQCVGLYWNVEGGAAENTCQVRYRSRGSAVWQTALPLWYDGRGPESFDRLYSSDRDRYAPNKMFSVLSHSHQYRGSIVNLRPATEYEIELSVDDGRQRQVVTATTWSQSQRPSCLPGSLLKPVWSANRARPRVMFSTRMVRMRIRRLSMWLENETTVSRFVLPMLSSEV